MADGQAYGTKDGKPMYWGNNPGDQNELISQQAQPAMGAMTNAVNGMTPQTQNPVQQQQVQNPYIVQPTQQSGLSGAGVNRGYN